MVDMLNLNRWLKVLMVYHLCESWANYTYICMRVFVCVSVCGSISIIIIIVSSSCCLL